MNEIYDEYIKKCLEAYNNGSPAYYYCVIPSCGDATCPNEFCAEKLHCQNCLDRIFWQDEYRHLRYSCKPITYYYVLRYLNRYASEMNYIFNHFSFWNNNFGHKNIVSIGSGPACEFVGFEFVFRARATNMDSCHFYAYEMNPIWSDVQHFLSDIVETQSPAVNLFFKNENFDETDSLAGDIDIVILNYVLSDIHKHSEKEGADFVLSGRDFEVEEYLESRIQPILNRMKSGSYLIINDTNSNNMGRDAIETWVDELTGFDIHKFVFNYSSRYSEQKFKTNCKVLPKESLKFQSSEDISFFTDSISECRSAFVVIKKL